MGGGGASRAEPGVVDLVRLAEALSDGLALCRDGRILWASPRLAELAGRADAAELLGAQLDLLLEDTGSGLPGSDTRRAVACRLERPDGESRSVVVRRAAAEPGSGAVVWVIQDVTHVRILEEEVLRSSRELAARNRELVAAREQLRRETEEREELLTVVSHELRTPVTVITGYNRLLLSEKVGPLNEEQLRFLHESTKSCQRLNTFIGNLLEASRELGGEAALEVCEAPLAPTIEGVVAFLKPLLEERELSVELDIDPAGSVARFDAVRIEQVMTNLLSNAMRYAPLGGRLEISTRRIERDRRPLVEVAVADDGPGVPPEDRARIFLPYVRTGAALGAGGLGLGLALCQRIVEAHGGSIGVSDRPGGGSRFAFTLPAPERASEGA